jgi:hypothetical protein
MLRLVKGVGRQFFQRVGSSAWNRQRILRQTEKLDRVQMGSVADYFPRWLNITLLSSYRLHPYGALRTVGSAHVLHYDLTRPLPIRDGSMQYVYSSHFVEHLTQAQGKAFFRECCRIMRPGVVIRTVCPDLKPDSRTRRTIPPSSSCITRSRVDPSGVENKGEIFNCQMRAWGQLTLRLRTPGRPGGCRPGCYPRAPSESVIPDIDSWNSDEIRRQKACLSRRESRRC